MPIRVCLCDDVQEFRRLMRYGLEEDDGIEIVGEAADCEEAVEAISELHPDVALLDLSMPGMGGLEVMEAMRDLAPATRIVVLSGFAASRMEGSALERGAARYLEKGASLAEVRAAIHAVAEEPGGP